MFAIRTKRLILRDLALRDVPRLNEFFTDRVVTREMGFVRTRNIRETRAWVKRAIFHNRKRPRDAHSLAVITRKDRKIVGWIGFGSAEGNKRHIGERDFGFAFRKECWGMGYGTESLRGITDFIFAKLKGRSFFGDHAVSNPASGRVMEKCGFRRLPRRVRGIDAASRGWIITRESWLRRRRTPRLAAVLLAMGGLFVHDRVMASPRIAFDSAPGRDSFSLTMQAGAGLLGIKARYAEILALSTNGFAPDVGPDEECRSDWMTRGRGQCLDLVAGRLGINVRPLGGFAPRERGEKYAPDAAKRAAALIREALGKGEVVITDSGWNESFALWGIVTGADEDGRIAGANPAAAKNSLDHVCSFWALSRGGRAMPQPEADRVMLVRAVARIRGDREPFRPESLACGLPAVGAPAVPGRVVWGLPAMDLWIAQMEKPAYQQDDPGSSAGNARMCALYVATGAKATAAYLRSRVNSFPAGARRSLESVAGRYDRIAALLEPYTVWKKGKGYQAFMGDPAKQKEHADKVLGPVRAELAGAADEIDTALAATGTGEEPRVKHDGTRTFIEDVPNIEMGWIGLTKGMQILLLQRGEKVTLEDVMVASGDAFHLCHGTKWELRTEHAIPTDLLANAAESYGYEAHWTRPHMFMEMKGMSEQERKRLADEYWGEIRQSIDAGRPVLLGGAYGQCSQWRVAVGYDRANGLVCYVGGEKPYDWTAILDEKAKKLGHWDAQARGPLVEGFVGGWIQNAAFLLGGKKSSVSDRDRAVMILRRAISLHNAKPFITTWYGGVTYNFGAAAYEQWAKDLDALDYPADLSRPRTSSAEILDMSMLGYQSKQIAEGRLAAAAFCEKAAAVLPDGRDQLLGVARAYREEAAIAKEVFAVFLTGTEEGRKAWLSSEANRTAGVAAIRSMLRKERAAIGGIETALVGTGPVEEPRMKREGDRVEIEGVPALKWANIKPCTWAGATEAALAPTAHPYTYARIMEMSALAFRARWYRTNDGKDWCPSTAIGELGDEYQLFFRESGWQWRTEVRGGGADMTPLVPDVVKSIDAGLPVVCYDDHLDMAVAFGYTAKGKTLLFRDYYAGDKVLELPASKLGWLLYFPTAFTAAMPEREAVLESLKLAVDNWTRDPMPGGGGAGAYLYGRAALEGWADDIGKAEALDQKQREKLFFVSWFCCDALDDSTRFQRNFLERAAKVLGGKAADHLLRAADLLGKNPPLLRGAYEKKDAFLGPWSGKDIKAWTPEVRAREQEILRTVAVNSDPAFAAMREALSAIR